jgi:hypothetical protein
MQVEIQMHEQKQEKCKSNGSAVRNTNREMKTEMEMEKL